MDDIEAMLRRPLLRDEGEGEVVFPLTAVVGHQEAKRAIILALINPGLSLIMYGDRGLGKKTMLRSLVNFLPDIRSTGCVFNCDPNAPFLMCTDCKKGGWTERDVRRPFVMLPYAVDVGSLTGDASDPYSSILGSANRGILAIRDMENYPSEVVESIFSHLSKRKVSLGNYEYPSFFQPIATYNGWPGHLMDRFILKARVEQIRDIEERIEISRRVEMFRRDPQGFRKLYGREEERLRSRIEEGRDMLRRIDIPEGAMERIRDIVERNGLEKGYERRLMIASSTNAAYEGHMAVSEDDVMEVSRMILPRRP